MTIAPAHVPVTCFIHDSVPTMIVSCFSPCMNLPFYNHARSVRIPSVRTLFQTRSMSLGVITVLVPHVLTSFSAFCQTSPVLRLNTTLYCRAPVVRDFRRQYPFAFVSRSRPIALDPLSSHRNKPIPSLPIPAAPAYVARHCVAQTISHILWSNKIPGTPDRYCMQAVAILHGKTMYVIIFLSL